MDQSKDHALSPGTGQYGLQPDGTYLARETENIVLDTCNYVILAKVLPRDSSSPPVSLRALALRMAQYGMQYCPPRFCAARFRLNKMDEPCRRCTVVVFDGGVCVCTGGNDLHGVEQNLEKFVERLNENGFNVRLCDTQICNIVYNAHLPFAIDVEMLRRLNPNVHYDADFPGARVSLQASDFVHTEFFEGDHEFEAQRRRDMQLLQDSVRRAANETDMEAKVRALQPQVELRRRELYETGARSCMLEDVNVHNLRMNRVERAYCDDCTEQPASTEPNERADDDSGGVYAAPAALAVPAVHYRRSLRSLRSTQNESYRMLAFRAGELVLPGMQSAPEAIKVIRAMVALARPCYYIYVNGRIQRKIVFPGPPKITVNQNSGERMLSRNSRNEYIDRLADASRILGLPAEVLALPCARVTHTAGKRLPTPGSGRKKTGAAASTPGVKRRKAAKF
jgi:TATA-box binding protein (TBP) (component of TFIID and TFIIIB)